MEERLLCKQRVVGFESHRVHVLIDEEDGMHQVLEVETLEEKIPGDTTRLRHLPPRVLAVDEDAVRLVARLTRQGGQETEPVVVAAFNSYI